MRCRSGLRDEVIETACLVFIVSDDDVSAIARELREELRPLSAISALGAPSVATMDIGRGIHDFRDDGERKSVEVVVESGDDHILASIAQGDDEPDDFSRRELYFVERDDVRFGIDEVAEFCDGLEADGGFLETFSAPADASVASIRAGTEELESLPTVIAAELEVAQERLGFPAEHRPAVDRDEADLWKRTQCHELTP